LILYKAFELNDVTVSRPFLVQLARSIQEPHHDRRMGERSWLMLLTNEEGEASDDDLPTVRWWLAYALLDRKEWLEAKVAIDAVLVDCEAGRWDLIYLAEANYLASLCAFGRQHKAACKTSLQKYFEVAHSFDRNRADAILLQFWAEEVPSEVPSLRSMCRRIIAQHADLAEQLVQYEEGAQVLLDDGGRYYDTMASEIELLDEQLKAVWDTDTFSRHTWLRSTVKRALGVDGEDPVMAEYKRIKELFPKELPPYQEAEERRERRADMLDRIETSGCFGVTVRFKEKS